MLTSPEDNLIQIFERSFHQNWDLKAVTDYGTTYSLTYGQLAEEIWKYHRLFKNNGVKKGDKIALMGRNNVHWVTIYLSTITYGAIIVPVMQDFTPDDALHIFNHSESIMLFITDQIWESLDMDQMPKMKVVYSLTNLKTLAVRNAIPKKEFSYAEEEFRAEYPNGMKPEDVAYDKRENSEVLSINYTSGTTGYSKGVITPCNAMAGNIKLAFQSGLVFPGCRHVAFLPLAHAYGCAFDFMSCLAAGGHAHLIGRTPAAKVLLQAFAEVKPTTILSVPLILEKIYKKLIVPQISKPPVSWVLKVPGLDEIVLTKIRETLVNAFGGAFREVIIGGAPLNAEVEAFLKRIKFPLTVGYGMTECAPLIAYTDYEHFKTYSCGRALDGLMEARISKPDADGVGEIETRGENVMLGYYKNREATKEAFTKDGWLKTGDLGLIDEDGFIFIKGRSKTMLLGPNGQNIYPEEIEEKLNNMPYVNESLVIQSGSKLIALVYPDMEALDNSEIEQENVPEEMEKIRKDLNTRLAAYEQITKIKIHNQEFEKTPKKSIKRFLYTSMGED